MPMTHIIPSGRDIPSKRDFILRGLRAFKNIVNVIEDDGQASSS